MPKTIWPLLATLWMLLGAACTRPVIIDSSPAATRPTTPAQSTGAEINALMQASVDAWNQGDMDGFLLPYLESPQTTYVGSGGLVRGKAAIRERYESSYWRNGTPGETLRFEGIEVRLLGPENALATGRWMVADRASGETTGSGIFSLVLRRTADGWRIIHDHSS